MRVKVTARLAPHWLLVQSSCIPLARVPSGRGCSMNTSQRSARERFCTFSEADADGQPAPADLVEHQRRHAAWCRRCGVTRWPHTPWGGAPTGGPMFRLPATSPRSVDRRCLVPVSVVGGVGAGERTGVGRRGGGRRGGGWLVVAVLGDVHGGEDTAPDQHRDRQQGGNRPRGGAATSIASGWASPPAVVGAGGGSYGLRPRWGPAGCRWPWMGPAVGWSGQTGGCTVGFGRIFGIIIASRAASANSMVVG